LDWLEKFTFPLEASFKDEDKAKLVYEKVVKRTLANGTTSASYFGTLHERATCILADTCLKLGQRAYIGKVCMNTNIPDYYQDESVEEALAIQDRVTKYIEKIDPNFTLVKPIITPRFAVSCTANMLAKLGEYARKHPNLPIQTHLSENKAEVDFVKKLFPKESSYTGIYNSFNLLRTNTILAHCVHLTPEEIELIKSTGAGISHCGSSNTSLSSGEANIRLYKKVGRSRYRLKIGWTQNWIGH
jgi:guanine deaminase